VLLRPSACGKLRSLPFFFRSSALRFCQPAATKLLLRNTRQIRLDVEDGSSIKHINSSHVKRPPLTSNQLQNRQPNWIGAARRSRCENSVRTRIGWRRSYQLVSLGTIKHPNNKQVRETVNVS